MSRLPIQPHLKRYRGAKEAISRKVATYNNMAQRVADHLNGLIANNPSDTQMYLFATLAPDLGLTMEQVREAISDGGHNGITISVTADDRVALARYKK